MANKNNDAGMASCESTKKPEPKEYRNMWGMHFENPTELGDFVVPGAQVVLSLFRRRNEDKSNIPKKKEELDENMPQCQFYQNAWEEVKDEDISVMWIGHATTLVKIDGLNILTDPIFSNYCAPGYIKKYLPSFAGAKRYRPPSCKIKNLPEIHAVVISHNHFDHLDESSVKELVERQKDYQTKWLVPKGLKKTMEGWGCEKVEEFNWWEEKPVDLKEGKKLKFVFTPAKHWSRRGAFDTNKTLWGSWVIEGLNSKKRYFFCGDTGYCEIFKNISEECGPFDVAAIPIGAYEPRDLMKPQHINPEEAVQIHFDLKAKYSFGVHWGTFKQLGCYEYYLDPPKAVKDALDKQQETLKKAEGKEGENDCKQNSFTCIQQGAIHVNPHEKHPVDFYLNRSKPNEGSEV